MQAEREKVARRMQGENTLWDGVPMSGSRCLHGWETATWGRATVGRIQALEETRQNAANVKREAKRKARATVLTTAHQAEVVLGR